MFGPLADAHPGFSEALALAGAACADQIGSIFARCIMASVKAISVWKDLT